MPLPLAVTRIGPSPALAGKAARETGRRVLSDAQVERVRRESAATLRGLRDALAERGQLAADAPDPRDVVESFETVYARRPVQQNEGGAMRNNCFWVYAIARLLRPSLVVESGTWRGLSAWLFAEAVPEARIVSFDVRRAEGRIDDPRIEFRGGDWSEDPEFGHLPERTLLYFDDHLSHLRRLSEAAARGARLVLVDDDYPAHTLYATGTPPVPTVAMLTDAALVTATPIVWERDGKRYETVMSDADRRAGGALIDWTLPMPDLTPVNRFVQQGPATLVGLRAR